jgi:hypothetical protein
MEFPVALQQHPLSSIPGRIMRTFSPDFSYKVSYRQPPATLISFLSFFNLHFYPHFRLILTLPLNIRKPCCICGVLSLCPVTASRLQYLGCLK